MEQAEGQHGGSVCLRPAGAILEAGSNLGIVGGTQSGHEGHCFSDCHFLLAGNQMEGCCWGTKLLCSPSSLP